MKKTTPPNLSAGTAHLLRVIAKLVEKTNPEDIASFLQNELDITKIKATHSKPKDYNLYLSSSEQVDLLSIASSLQKLDSRDEGINLLSMKKLSRKELESLGRLLGTPIIKTDNMDRLTQKIIEASIGSRLNSKAIRGKDL